MVSITPLLFFIFSLNDDIQDLQTSFQDGVNVIYNKITNHGVTPNSKTPVDIANSIDTCVNNAWSNGNTEGYNNGRTQGQNDVKNNPNGYGLYNKTQYDQNYNTGVTNGRNDVINNCNSYGLYNQSQYDQNYTNGYNAGNSAGWSSGHTAGYNEGYNDAKVNATLVDLGEYEIQQNKSVSVDIKSSVGNYGSLTVDNFYVRLVSANELDWTSASWGNNVYSQSYSNGVYTLSISSTNWSSSHNFNINIKFRLFVRA